VVSCDKWNSDFATTSLQPTPHCELASDVSSWLYIYIPKTFWTRYGNFAHRSVKHLPLDLV